VNSHERPSLTVLVNFFNMRREAERTLYTLTTKYQRGVDGARYEVVAIDNGSTEPLDSGFVESHGANFRHLVVETDCPSPCVAINRAAAASAARDVMVCIDGARMLSPGMMRYALSALDLYSNPFVYSLALHLGHRPQNELVAEGYCQRMEDELLSTIDWKSDGYRLFSVSSKAGSSGRGYLGWLSESNCFAMRKSDFLGLGGFDERFASAGGGLVNLDFFNQVNATAGITPVMLLGEATFHQFHGGVATNVPRSEHPWARMAAEYAEIRGRTFETVKRTPDLYGWLSPELHNRLLS
jgi:hypothetical protein